MPLDLILYILSPFLVGALIVGLFVALTRWIEREHREALAYRRREMGHLYVTNARNYPGRAHGSTSELIVAEYVLGCNAWTALVGRLKMLVGGEVGGFHDLATRARQEVVLRVMEQAAARGFDAVCNLRLESVDIAGQTTASGKQKNRAMSVGLIAHATAYTRAPNAYPPPAPPTLEGYLN